MNKSSLDRICAKCNKKYEYKHHLQDKDYCGFDCNIKDHARKNLVNKWITSIQKFGIVL